MSLLLSNILGAGLLAGMILSVFKTIGLVVLIIVIVIAILALCVLFVPIRYHLRGDIDEKDFSARLHWFLKIIMFRATMKDGATDYALYLFGIRTKLLDKEFLDKWKRRREKRKAKKAAKANKSRKKKYQKKHDKYKEQYLKENQMDEAELHAEMSDSLNKAGGAKEGEDPTKKSVSEKAHGVDPTEASKDSKNHSKNKVIDVLKKILHIIQVFRDYQPVQMIIEDIKKLMHHARPRKIKADIQFGFEDPATTGQLLGAISNVYFIYQYEDLVICPDFQTEEAYIKGNFDIKGYIQSVFGLIFIIKVIKKKRFRKFLKALKL